SFNLANRRIEQLYTLAEVSMIENPLFAIKCVKLAHKIASRSRVRISQSFRRKTCQKCFNFLRPSVNCQIRTRSSSQPHLVLHCYNCGKITRFPYKKVQ
ncbi:MAG: ribonuclease P protein component 4, partial [Candidatus Hodarchaeota archaeon]